MLGMPRRFFPVHHRRHVNKRVAGEAAADGVLALSNHSWGIDNV